MHIFCPREGEQQLLLPVKASCFLSSGEFKPQTNELVGQAGEIIHFFQWTFIHAFASSRRKNVFTRPNMFPYYIHIVQSRAMSVRTCSHLRKVLMARSKGVLKGPNADLHYASINSKQADQVHIPTLFLIYLCPTFWMPSQLLKFH